METSTPTISWRMVLLFIIAIIVLLIGYLSLRIVYWSTLSDQVRVVTEADTKEYLTQDNTLIISIEYAALQKVKNAGKFSLVKYLAKQVRNLGYWCFLIEIGIALAISLMFEFLLRVHGI